MSSIREKIISELKTQLSYISTANGYKNTLPSGNIHKGYVSTNDINQYPSAFFYIGSEKIEYNESYGLMKCEAEVVIGIYLQVNTGEGNLMDKSEAWVNDLKGFILGNENLSNKLDLEKIEGVEKYRIESLSPYIIDHSRNIGGVVIEMTVDYNESIEDDT